MKRIWIDGREYASPEEMPPHVRAEYERALSGADDGGREGLPEVVELDAEETEVVEEMELSALPGSGPLEGEVREVHTRTEITVNGKKYSSWDEVPEESRKLLKRVMGDLPQGGGGMGGMADARAFFEKMTDDLDVLDQKGFDTEVVRTEVREVRSGEDTEPTVTVTPSGTPRIRSTPREVRIHLSGGWGWVVALVLAALLLALLFFGG